MGFNVLIPARLASTRLPGKPLADINGLPMVVRVAQRAAASGADAVVVAADDASIPKVKMESSMSLVMKILPCATSNRFANGIRRTSCRCCISIAVT